MDFTRDLDSLISKQIKKNLGLKIKFLSIRHLFESIMRKEAKNGWLDTVLPGLLMEDSVHLNLKGYTVMVRNISAPVLTYWGTEREKVNPSQAPRKYRWKPYAKNRHFYGRPHYNYRY